MTKQNQLSETAVRERLRAKTPDVLERLAKLVNSRNDSVALGACRLILDKVVSNMKPAGSEPYQTIPIPLMGFDELNMTPEQRLIEVLARIKGLQEEGELQGVTITQELEDCIKSKPGYYLQKPPG